MTNNQSIVSELRELESKATPSPWHERRLISLMNR